MQTSSSIDQSSIMCDYCGKYLNKEYYFKCKSCSSIYCFTHKSKHSSCNNHITI